MRFFTKVSLVVCFALSSVPAIADVIYNDRTTFESAIDSSLTTSTITFENFGAGNFISFSLPQGPGFQSNPPLTPDSGLTQDLEIGTGFSSAIGQYLVGHAGKIYSNLPGGTFAVGMNLGGVFPSNQPAPTFTIQTFDWNLNVSSTVNFTADLTNSSFIGFISASDIRMVVLSSNSTLNGVTLDNYTFAHTPFPVAVPEPATSSILCSLAMAAAYFRRRRIKSARRTDRS